MEIIEPRIRPVGAGSVRRVLPVARRRMVGPVVFLDVIGPETIAPGSAVDIPEHPHIGLSTLTYLLDGRLEHRDSTGAHQVIEPGDVNWMTAGSGVTHIERSVPEDVDRHVLMRGVQIWIALPVGLEDGDPFFAHVRAGELPVLQRGAATLRLVAGTGWGLESPVPVSSPLVLADVALDGTGSFDIDTSHIERGVLALEGEIEVGGSSLDTGHLAVIDSRDDIRVNGWGRFLVIGGEPVGKRHISWNFVHSDRRVIDRAHERWDAGGFPRTMN